MNVTALGHSALLLEVPTTESEGPTRILVDPWLSDHCVGDLFGRWPRLDWTGEDLGPIHAVFLSHAHTDHLDPYTLVRLWRELPEPPLLLLPATLRFLVPLFRAHLPGVEVQLLRPERKVTVRGVSITGLFAASKLHTNEDDVMVLLVGNGTELALVEADCRLDVHNAALMRTLHRAFTRKGVRSVCWLTTENELDASLPMAGCTDGGEILERSLEGLAGVEVETDQLYVDVARPSPWSLPHLCRAIHGQGLTPPPEVDPRWERLLYPVRIADRVRIERRIAAEQGFEHTICELRPGWTYRLADGALTEVGPTDAVQLRDPEDPRGCDPSLPGAPQRATGPVRPGLRDVEAQEQRILDALNHRLLPFLVGQNQPPLFRLLDGLGGVYRVRVHYGNPADDAVRDYVLHLGEPTFRREDVRGRPFEAYWANDLEDRLDGRSDEFTTFFRQELEVQAPLLGHVLSLPVISYDLVFRKVKLHFERAARGETAGEFVGGLLEGRPGS